MHDVTQHQTETGKQHAGGRPQSGPNGNQTRTVSRANEADVHDHPVRQGDHQNKQNEREPTAQRALHVAQLTDMGHMVSL